MLVKHVQLRFQGASSKVKKVDSVYLELEQQERMSREEPNKLNHTFCTILS